jgi:hypothetical protein
VRPETAQLALALGRLLAAGLARVTKLAPALAEALRADDAIRRARATFALPIDGVVVRDLEAGDAHRDIEEPVAEIERLVGEAERIADPVERDAAREAAASMIDAIASALARINELAGADAGRLADDELLGMLHVLAGTHPDTPKARAQRALEVAVAELGSLGVRLLDVRDGDGLAVRLVAERGAKVDPARARGMVEMIVLTRAPDLEGLVVEIEGVVAADPQFVPLGRLRPSQAHSKCSLCARPIEEKHDHLYSPAKREIACACFECALIVPSSDHAAFRKVPTGVQRIAVRDVAGWLDRLNVPVGVAALIPSDGGGARLAYPGPAGLVESTVDPALWRALCDDVPVAGQLAPEVEALVWSGLTHDVLRTGIDVVFRLVGELRTHWRGITGGDGPAQLAKVLASIVEAA